MNFLSSTNATQACHFGAAMRALVLMTIGMTALRLSPRPGVPVS